LWTDLGFNNDRVEELHYMKTRADELIEEGYTDKLQAAIELCDCAQMFLQYAQTADEIGREVLLTKAAEVLDACKRLVASEKEIEGFTVYGIWGGKNTLRHARGTGWFGRAEPLNMYLSSHSSV
jgi:hypothetical protein